MKLIVIGRPAASPQFLLDFGHVAMMAYGIGCDGLGDFGEEIGFLEAAPRARDPRHRVDRDPVGNDCTGGNQRPQRQQHCGRVAARASDKRRGGQRAPRELSQSIDCIRKQAGGRMVAAVPFGVDSGVAQPEIGRKVDDLRAGNSGQ